MMIKMMNMKCEPDEFTINFDEPWDTSECCCAA